MTEFKDLLLIILAFSITFIANICSLDFYLTFQTFPNPPLPIQYMNWKWLMEMTYTGFFTVGWTTSVAS